MNWMHEEEREFWVSYCRQQERYMLDLDPLPEPKPVCNKKWAWIEVDGDRQMQWVDNVTMKAYKRDGYGKTDVEIPEYNFERWCRPMDL